MRFREALDSLSATGNPGKALSEAVTLADEAQAEFKRHIKALHYGRY